MAQWQNVPSGGGGGSNSVSNNVSLHGTQYFGAASNGSGGDSTGPMRRNSTHSRNDSLGASMELVQVSGVHVTGMASARPPSRSSE